MLVAILTSFSFTSKAQEGGFSAGAEIGLPMGDFGDFASTGFGASIRYEAGMSDNLALTGDLGYLTFSTDFDESVNMIPIQAGAKYYTDEVGSGFYAMGQFGVHNTSFGDNSETNLSFAPSAGYAMESIDIGLRYQVVNGDNTNTSYIGLRGAYKF
ncbi:MAG: outer membrane beta-barrel protein [Flavobacteriales bacterium]